ncbi:hypothetical protein VP01_14837g1 [Puccinia sorghi]|uniref:Uncharacterized protein n=1 Tax=Puccinia sorghi TaxID=27349 RepID=A0A0L6VJG7_9BASI|nr:hypothetical protein VP01_14837g1 [Puccinia sorghi]
MSSVAATAETRSHPLTCISSTPYWNPVNNIALGIMHNWYEGVLQHWRIHWAFDAAPSKHITHDDMLDVWEKNGSEISESTQEFQDSAFFHIQNVIPQIIIPMGVTQVPPYLGDPFKLCCCCLFKVPCF